MLFRKLVNIFNVGTLVHLHFVKELRNFGPGGKIFVESEKPLERELLRTDEIVLDITSITISSNQYNFNFISHCIFSALYSTVIRTSLGPFPLSSYLLCFARMS